MKTSTLPLALLALLGCGESSGDATDKGPESALPDEGKNDSFNRPTDHGVVSFSLTGSATLGEGTHFHAWTFTLGAEAQVSLAVEPSTDNLDTVMYLYRRAPGTTRWGSYIARNDDYKGALWSRVDKKLAAGEYRVLVKGFKVSIRGGFALRATCDGAGCPTAEAPSDLTLPNEAAPTAKCLSEMASVVTSDFVSKDVRTVNYETERTALEGTSRLAVEYYEQYWTELDQWEGFAEGSETGERTLEVERFQLEEGSLVDVNIEGGDETRLAFTFDAEDKLVMFLHDEQSATTHWFCGGESAEIEEPDAFCVSAYLAHTPHSGDDESEVTGSSKVNALNSVNDGAIKLALRDYAATNAPTASATLSYTGARWTSAGYGAGMNLTVKTTGKPTVEYALGYEEGDSAWLFFRGAGESAELVCAQP